ncbi:MAG: hypothetical protein V4537_07370 [Pseudomonadota bacterium]
MIVGILLVALALGMMIALSVQPKRAIVALPAALATIALLVEGAGAAPRGAILAGLAVGLLLSIDWRTRDPDAGDPRDPATIAADAAWGRLAASAGLLTRGRVAAIRRRREILVARDLDIDPFSTFGELRIKLERRVPELIENYLDEAATAPALKRHGLMSELLGEVERLVARAEAVDPAAIARAERRTALRNHLGAGSDRTPVE